MGLEAERPLGMGLAIGHHLRHVLPRAWLEEVPLGRKGQPWGDVLARVDQLQLVGRPEHRLRLGVPVPLRAHGDPVDPVGQGMRAVGLDMDEVARPMEQVHELLVDLEGRLPSRQADPPACATELPDLGQDLVPEHVPALREVGVAEGAPEVAEGEADEDHGKASPPSFALERIEDLVYLVGSGHLSRFLPIRRTRPSRRRPCCSRSPRPRPCSSCPRCRRSTWLCSRPSG